ncbi:RNA-guided endonuclease InsQ/TnpB family protein [Actinokineospora xionganensis]|uniref:RNA-guided endonuclease InsQ/TnpB family protein n=1 Tax=Actinokineospora xionganensis TaxID=2684470 RepID=UPI001C9D5D51|nr:RNA-guided endonuclease TnpB family protein [Actinokineospora xionganensis]
MSKQGFRVELAPTDEQRVLLGQHAGLSRLVENFALERVKAALDQREAEKTYGVAEGGLTPVPWSAPALESAWRAAHPVRFPWFTEAGLSSRVPKEACRVRAAGFRTFFDSRSGKRKGPKVGFPSWRKRKHGGRFRYDADRAKPVDTRTVRLPGVGSIATREDMTWLVSRLAESEARVLGATVKERAGRWWISFQIEVDRAELDQRRAAPPDAPACGVDLGLTTFATVVDSDGTVTEIRAPKLLKAALRKLRRANKALARSRRGSANRAKRRAEVARVHLRVAHRRTDFLHKTTTRLARTKSAVAVETLNIVGMAGNRRLARAISDAGWGEFTRQLDYKARWYGSRVWKADRWFPSSKTCSTPGCGQRHGGLTLAERTWTCTGCGTVHHRDRNAATNLLAAMLADAA